jgi:hypothetical protein
MVLVLAACGGPAGPDPAGPGGQSDDAGSGGDGDGGNGNGAGAGGSSDGPITITVDGRTVGYEIGRCDVIDDVVYAQARTEGQAGFATIEVTLPEWDREIAHSRRDGGVQAVVPAEGGGVGWQLTAGRGDPGTTWEWTVSGSQVEVTAVMGDRTTANRESGIEEFVDYHDVTITMDCAGPFGTGMPEDPMHEEPFPLDPPVDRVPGSVTVDLEGSTYAITYLVHCQLSSNDVSAEGTSDEASIYFYSEGVGVNLDFEIGDQREPFESLERWMLPPDASLQSDFPFEGSGTTRSWTGDVVSESGAEAEATIAVECTEGDAFEGAGTASITVDGVTHQLDEVSACTIDGSTIDFFGRQATGGVALIVTSGGSEILYGDETGQTLTSGIDFSVNGQQATWSGTLSGDRQASVVIDCG